MERLGITLQAFTAADLEARIARRKREGIKNSTSRTECMLLSAMLTLGVKEKFLRKNPLVAYSMPLLRISKVDNRLDAKRLT